MIKLPVLWQSDKQFGTCSSLTVTSHYGSTFTCLSISKRNQRLIGTALLTLRRSVAGQRHAR